MAHFTRRYIDVTFIGKTTVKLTRHRASARIVVGGGASFGKAEVAIYGMKLDLMKQLATFSSRLPMQQNNQLRIEAGDDINGMSTVFEGGILQAWADFQSAPDVPFHVVAQSALIESVQRTGTDWNSYEGPTDVSTMMQNLAKIMGVQFENSGVNVKLESPYHYGSPYKQAQQIATAAKINMILENGVLAIWPINQARNGSGLYLSPQTGMVSYPTFTRDGVLVKSEYMRPVKFGTEVTIKSDLTPACGTWSVSLLDYDLQSLTPKGHWFVSIGCIDQRYSGPALWKG